MCSVFRQSISLTPDFSPVIIVPIVTPAVLTASHTVLQAEETAEAVLTLVCPVHRAEARS